MTIQDLKENRERIIKKIKTQVTLASKENIAGVMNKMVSIIKHYENEKSTMANIDKLTMRAITLYIRLDMVRTQQQNERIDEVIELKRRESLPSNLQF